MLLFLDVENYYDEKYTLSKISSIEYIRDSRFQLHGLSYAFDDEAVQWVGRAEVRDFLASVPWEYTTLVCHNTKYDGAVIAHHYGFAPLEYRDTQGMARAVLGRTVPSHSLGYLAQHFKLPPKKDMKTIGLRDLTPFQEAELAEYGKHDTWLCREIYRRLAPEFPDNQYPMLDWTIRIFCWPKYVLDVKTLEQEAAKEKAEKEAVLKSLGLSAEALRSQDQFAKLLADRGYKVPLKTSTKKKDEFGQPLKIPALAKNDLEFMEMLESKDKVLSQLCQARVMVKSNIIETRSESYANVGRTGPWPFDVQFSGAMNTHRLSGADGGGANPQNVPKKGALRNCIKPPPGYALVVGDTSQIEARFVAYLSGDENLINDIENTDDLYGNYGVQLYGFMPKKGTLERDFSKEGVLGGGYGMGSEHLRLRFKQKNKIDIGEEMAQKATDAYRQRYAKVPLLWRRLNNWLGHLADGSQGSKFAWLPCLRWEKEAIILPSGLKMRYPNLRQEQRKDKKGRERLQWVYDVYLKGSLECHTIWGGMMLENICQALAGELIKECIVDCRECAYGQVHDEVHLIVRGEEAEQWRQWLEWRLCQAPVWMGQRMKLAAEVKTGKSWGETK